MPDEIEEKKAEPKIEPGQEKLPLEEKPSKNLRRINWTRVWIVLAILAFVLIFLWPGKILIGKSILQRQNYFNISYSIFVDDKIVETDSIIFKEGTLSQALGLASDKLDKEIANMQVGEERNITLAPEDAFGICDASKVYYYNRTTEVPREQEINRTIKIDYDEFKEIFNEEPVLNKSYSISFMPWKYKVIKIDEKVEISIEAQLDQEIPSNYFTFKVVKITEDKITLRAEGNSSAIATDYGTIEIKFTKDKIVYTLTPKIDEEIELPGLPKSRVVSLNDTTITLTNNHKYCDKSIMINLKLIAKTQEKQTSSAIKHIEGAPTMQVFIMSYCPYGLQILKGLLPVWREFQDKANIELRFVSYTMHGAKEEEENARMICIREEQNNKLLDYLECFVQTGNADQCLASSNIDKAKLNSCMSQRYEKYFAEDKALNEKYNVRGSPTVIIDGREVSIYPRDPQSIANALCDAFKTKPSECSKAFSTINPSPGFGSGSSSSGGSCG
ncbi:MAG: hypothetical protein QXW65_02120 [Candidatus Pacearchaeota archaeon]